MRRISDVALWCVICVVAALCGCSGQEGSPALAINDPEPTSVLASGADGGTVAKAGDQPAWISETADAALLAILNGLHENRPDAVWDALPGSYQKDVNDLVHLFAQRMHPEAARWFVQILRKGAGVLRLRREDEREEASVAGDTGGDDTGEDKADVIQQASVQDRLANLKDENSKLHQLLGRQQSQTDKMPESPDDIERRLAVAKLFDKIADAGPAGLEKLKTVDVGTLLRHDESQSLLEAWLAAVGAEFGSENVQDFLALVADPSQVRLVVKESTEETALVEIIFPNDVPGEIECVRVDRKWVPRLLADAWPETIANLKRSLLESLPSETPTENFGPLFQYLALIDMSFDGDLAQARRDGGEKDTPADAHRTALVDAPMLLLQFLIAGPPPSETDEPMMDADGILLDVPGRSEMGSPEEESRPEVSPFGELTGKSLFEADKRVAVLCLSGAQVQVEHPTLAVDVTQEISRRFKAGKMDVVEPEKVVAWAQAHADLTADSDLTGLATEIGANYIVQFQIDSLAFAEENFPALRRGRTNAQVVVLELADDENGQKSCRVVFKQPFESKYPGSAPITADAEEADAFKQRYLARLHFELARLFLREP